jgi:hypothetical protein
MDTYPWYGLYRAALLELVRDKVVERVATARHALTERLRESFKLTSDERNAIVDAQTVLQLLEDTERHIKSQRKAAG